MLAITALLAVGACRDAPAGPGGNAASLGPRYTLVQVGSLSLPRLVSSVGEDSMFLDAEVVTLQSDGVAAFVRTYRRVLGSTSTEIGNTTFSLRFQRTGAEISLNAGVVCVVAPCPALDASGSVDEDSLLLIYVFAPTTTYSYARIAGAGGAP